jgi:uncharacterized protein
VQTEDIRTQDYNEPLYRELNEQTPPMMPREAAPLAPFPSPNNPPWNSAVAFLVWLASVALIIFVPAVFIIPYLLQQNVNLSDSAALVEVSTKDPTAILIQIAAIVPAHILTFLLAWLVVTNFRKYSFRETLGWQWGGFNIFYCILITVLFFALAIALTAVFGEQDHELQRILRSSRAAVYVVAFMATFTAPIVEEVIYRGLLFSAFQRRAGTTWAVVIVTFLFAAVHFWQYQSSPVALLMICSLSLVLTLIRAYTGNLWPCIVLHTIFNGLQALLMILQPFLEEAARQQQPPAEPAVFLFLLFK